MNVTKTQYTLRPTKAVHLFRHPLDNIVARMHRGIGKRRSMGWTEAQLAKFTDSKQGLAAWCQLIDARFTTFPKFYKVTKQQAKWMRDVPCWSDLFRYVQWHNWAMAMAQDLDLSVHTIFYEDYAARLDKTVTELARFLDLPMVQDSLPFETGKNYDHLFSTKQKWAAAQLIQDWASNECWAHIRNYVTPWLQQDITLPSVTDSPPKLPMANVPTLPARKTVDGKEPKIVWLMSFPNSGTSYTISNTKQITNATTATNYATEALYLSDHLIPVRSDLPAGPFILYPNHPVPPYVLTKTHCTGFCDGCNALNTLLSLRAFSEACRTTSMGQRPHLTRTAQPYAPARAVHLVRHPVDNLVARKHLGVKQRLQSGEFKNASAYDDSKEGVTNWCNYVDTLFEMEEQGRSVTIFSEEMRRRMKMVPCYSEWYRYVYPVLVQLFNGSLDCMVPRTQCACRK